MSKSEKITALYERLSRDDDMDGESNSISVWHYSFTCPIVRHSAFSEKGVMQDVRWHLMIENNWILCPICRNKTRIKIRGDTVLENFPLYCPKCKQENLIRAYQLNIIVIKEPDAQTQSR